MRRLSLGWPVLSPLSALAAQAKAGDDGAFDALMRETQTRVTAIAWRLLDYTTGEV